MKSEKSPSNVIAFEAGDEDLKELRKMAKGSGGNIREMQ